MIPAIIPKSAHSVLFQDLKQGNKLGCLGATLPFYKILVNYWHAVNYLLLE